MRTAMRLIGYLTALALVFGASWQVGVALGRPAPVAAAGPASPAPPPPSPPPSSPPPGPAPDGSPPDGSSTDGRLGLAATAAGYTLTLSNATFTPGRSAELAFAITGPDGRPVIDYATTNERPIHVFVVRRDAAGYQRLQPALGPGGRWRAPLVLPAAGVYRLYVEFALPGGPTLVLGTDLFGPGEFAPIPFGPSRVAQIDGYQVRLDGDLVPGSPSQVFATISRNGVAVTDLQPYLGSFGQLLALRRSDLAYQRVQSDVGRRPRPTGPVRPSRSPLRCRPRAATGCSSTSGTASGCTRPSSRSTPGTGPSAFNAPSRKVRQATRRPRRSQAALSEGPSTPDGRTFLRLISKHLDPPICAPTFLGWGTSHEHRHPNDLDPARAGARRAEHPARRSGRVR